jgi:hypothetical protein
VAPATTAVGAAAHRMSTHRATSHGVTCMASDAVTPAVTSSQGASCWHAANADGGNESSQCAAKHVALL